MFAGFESHRIRANGIEIAGVKGGSGPPLLLLHGHPQTHVIWHRIAGRLAERFTVIATDLRGYGDSGKPKGLPDHGNYSKRTVAEDQVAVMKALGHEAFLVVGHDRGGRVAYRMALDHPARVRKLVTLDIAPTLAMYEQTTMEFAKAYYHWFFLIQPAPFPETLMSADPEFFLKGFMGRRSGGLAHFAPEAFAEYLRCFRLPDTPHGICEDYRASATIDLEHERIDLAAGRKIECPMLALWGGDGAVDKYFRPIDEWKRLARNVDGHSLPCGHYIPEEAPELLLAELLEFL